MDRRTFILASAAGIGALATGLRAGDAPAWKTKLRKALIRGFPAPAELAALRRAGFDGIETTEWNAAPAAAEQARRTAEEHGLQYHAVLRGWCTFHNPDTAAVAAEVQSVERALETAARVGAGAVLLVPGRLDKLALPKPWEFDVEFDPDTALLRRVTRGDPAPHAAYIEAHNTATVKCREELRRLAPAAGKARVTIAVENVWNNLWVTPDHFAAFVRSVGSPWVQAYLDLGNHVKYAPTEQWVRALGPLITRCHVKDFKLNADGRDGTWADPPGGSVRWPEVRRELDRIGYNGWLTLEGSGHLALDEQARRLDRIIAGT